LLNLVRPGVSVLWCSLLFNGDVDPFILTQLGPITLRIYITT
jgi:hypothetical protein